MVGVLLRAVDLRLEQVPAAQELHKELPTVVASQGFGLEPITLVPLTLVYGMDTGNGPMPNRDPFNRLLSDQAELTRLTLERLNPTPQALS